MLKKTVFRVYLVMIFTTKLEQLRKYHDVTPQELGGLIGFSVTQIRDVEAGKTRNPSYHFVDQVCKVFKISKKYFDLDSVSIEAGKKIAEDEKMLTILNQLPAHEIEIFKTWAKSRFLELKARDAEQLIGEIEQSY